MSISSRIQDSIESWSQLWGDRLKAWFTAIVSFGLEIFMDVLGKSFAPKLTPIIERLEATGQVPPELQPLLDEIKSPKGEVGAILAQSAGGALVGGAIGSIMDALFLRFSYSMMKISHPKLPNEAQLIGMWLRGNMSPESLEDYLQALGADDITILTLKELSQVRLPPELVMRLWIRDKPAWEHLWKDLVDNGVSPDRIVAFKEASHLMPTYGQVVDFMAHEVFEEDAVTKYGLDHEFEKLDLSWFAKVGVRPELAKMLWRDHWKHPAFREITEMLHRGELVDEDVYDWYRLVEIPPHWRDKLTAISWDLPNRIELRMMARYGLVNKEFLVEQLKLVGLREDFRSIAADMMLAMGIRTDLSTRFSKGWLTADQVKEELKVSGLSDEVGERMYQWIVKNTAGDRVVDETNLSKSEIYTGVKKGVITWSQGLELLQDHNLTLEEAQFILEIRVGALEGSPETYQEFKKITQLYKKSQGLDAKVPSIDLIEAEKAVIADPTEENKLRYHQLLQEFTKKE